MSAATQGAALEDVGTAPTPPEFAKKEPWGWDVVGLVVVFALAALTQFLVNWVPRVTEGTPFGAVAESIEFPVYAIILGFGANAVLSLLKVRDRMAGGFRTEFFIKTGVVLLGASINIGVVIRAAGPAVLQGLGMITAVFFFTWWLSGRLGLDDKLRALLASALSICGVSAAIAAAGSVNAKKEQLAYTASLVILFAVPAIFLMPWLADLMNLPSPVAGAWIGGNIDTTAAVSAAGAIAGEEALQIATIVKVTQNAMLGVVAVALSVYFAFRVERRADAARPSFGVIWDRFPKFVLGFIAASVAATIYLALAADPVASKEVISTINALRTWFLVLAFVSIGLEFKAGSLKDAGWKPIVVFAAATVFNMVFGLGLALLLFNSFTF